MTFVNEITKVFHDFCYIKIEIKINVNIMTKEDVINILRTYDNVFGLNDGGFAMDDEDFEHAAEVVLEYINSQNN